MNYCSSRTYLAVALGFSLLGSGPVSAIAQEGLRPNRPKNVPTGPAPRAADGKPDLSGYWKDDGNADPLGNIGKDLPGYKLPFTPAGAAALKYNFEHTIDPGSVCIPRGFPRAITEYGIGFQLLQSKGITAFLYLLDNTFRLVATDGRTHPEDPDPAYFGQAIGSWDGDTFVIDSVAFKDTNSWIDENANPHSDAMHTIERWTRPDLGHLHLELTVEDPKFYTQPIHYQRTWVNSPQDIREEACSENNIGHYGTGPGAIRPDGTRGYDHLAPLPPLPTPDNPARTILPPGVK